MRLPRYRRHASRASVKKSVIQSDRPMTVNLAVCGRFLYHNYVRYLGAAGVLGRFYYSHRLGTTARQLGLSEAVAKNVWLKEYLIQLHGKVAKARKVQVLAPLYVD